ncbi:MAG: hypothetical protein C0467_30040 [Planctomycetaceae bacterium]|nr:hypothetical protein [Planctomycetaceae bacterium]
MPRTKTSPENPDKVRKNPDIKRAITDTAPIVCKPLGTLALVDVPGFPEGAGGYLLTSKCNTLADLEKRAAKHTSYSGMDSRVYAAFRSIPGFTQDVAKAAMTAVMAMLHVSPMPETQPAKVKEPEKPFPVTDPVATDFTENTPPPRTRPQGDPVRPFVSVPPGAVESEFAAWDKAGRIPEGSVLARFVGGFTRPDPRTPTISGYETQNGRELTVSEVDRLKQITTIREQVTGKLFVVLAPEDS